MFARKRLALLSVVVLMTGVAEAGLLPERIAKAAQERVDVGQYPALVIGFVDGDRSEVVGFGKLQNGKLATGDTLFEIGSVTKTFTATLLAKAVVDGKARLDEPLTDLVPDWKVPDRNDKKITLGDVASQRSGLPRMPGNFTPKDPANPYADYDVSKLKAFLAAYQLPRDPGASYEYSNIGFAVLGTALAQAEHKPYPQLLQDQVLSPLGMNHSSAANIAPPELVPGHLENGKPAKNWDLDAFGPAGAIRSSANDMLRYLKANMHPDQSALGKAMTLAQTPRADIGAGSRIGLAWMTSAPGIVWHSGMTGGYASFVGFTADRKQGVVILTNIARSVDELGMAALVPDAPLAAAHKAIAMSDNALDEYVGIYQLVPGFSIGVFSSDHQLYAMGTGQPPFPIYPSAKDEFFASIAAISISFKRDEAGRITGGVLHQNGDRPITRLPDPPVLTLDAAALQDYIGKYQLDPGTVIDVAVKERGLFVQLTGKPSFEVYASAKDGFFYKGMEIRIDFERDASGKVVALVFRRNGKDIRSPRIAP